MLEVDGVEMVAGELEGVEDGGGAAAFELAVGEGGDELGEGELEGLVAVDDGESEGGGATDAGP